MISLRNITKFYKYGSLEYRALYNISFDVDCGEYVFICGGSGSGKTTLLNILGCMDTFDYGEYIFSNMSIANKKDIELSKLRNEEFGFISNSIRLIPELNLFENVGIPLLYSRFSKEEKRERILKYLSMFSIDKYKYLPIDSLCKKDKQIACIARALVGGAKVIIGDEPCKYLEKSDYGEIFDILISLNKQGITLIISGSELNSYSDGSKVINLRDGMM